MSVFAESVSSGVRSRSSGALSCQPVPRRAASTRVPAPGKGAPTGSMRSSSISSACAKSGDVSTSAVPVVLSASTSARAVQADTRVGAVRSMTTSSGCPGHSPPMRSSTRSLPASRGVTAIVKTGVAIARSAAGSSTKLSARAFASAAISRSTAAREARSPRPAIRNVAPSRSSANDSPATAAWTSTRAMPLAP